MSLKVSKASKRNEWMLINSKRSDCYISKERLARNVREKSGAEKERKQALGMGDVYPLYEALRG